MSILVSLTAEDAEGAEEARVSYRRDRGGHGREQPIVLVLCSFYSAALLRVLRGQKHNANLFPDKLAGLQEMARGINFRARKAVSQEEWLRTVSSPVCQV